MKKKTRYSENVYIYVRIICKRLIFGFLNLLQGNVRMWNSVSSENPFSIEKMKRKNMRQNFHFFFSSDGTHSNIALKMVFKDQNSDIL